MLLFLVTPQILVPTLASTYTILFISPLCPTVVHPAIGPANTAFLLTFYNRTSPMRTAVFLAFHVVISTEAAIAIYIMETVCVYLGCRSAEICLSNVECSA